MDVLQDSYRNPLMIEWYSNPIHFNENLVVINKRAPLTYIPDEFQKVVIIGLSETKGIPLVGQYRVNYTNGEIEFHENTVDGTVRNADYYGRGLIKYPATRVILEDKDDVFVDKTVEGSVTSLQKQLNQTVIEGDSSVEAAQARVDQFGTVYGTLKQRIDSEQNKILIKEILPGDTAITLEGLTMGDIVLSRRKVILGTVTLA